MQKLAQQNHAKKKKKKKKPQWTKFDIKVKAT